jgi:gluconate 2-dehydrogenase gamma chain
MTPDNREPGTAPTDDTDDEGNSTKPVKSAKSVGAVGMERRDALKAMAAAAGLPLLDHLTAERLDAQATPSAHPTATPAGQQPVPHPVPHPVPIGGPRGTPSDPDLLHPKADWPRLLSAAELATLSVLCDAIIPADEHSPGASSVGVPAYINQYVSAPYEGQQRDLIRIRGGLAWLNTESDRRFGRPFVRLTPTERTQICDDICYVPKAKPEFQAAARFFDQVRDLTATGFYTTREGMADLKYIGNVALPRFDGPPPEVLRHIGL